MMPLPRFWRLAAGCAALWLVFARPASAALPEYTLGECLEMTVRQNPDVLIAAKRVDAARALVTQARAGIFPTLAASGYYQRRERSLSSSGGIATGIRSDDYNADVRLVQNLYSSGAVRNRLAAAKLGAEVARLDYLTALDTAALQVREAFNTTLAAEQGIAVNQQAVDLLAAQLKDQQQRLAAGTAGQLNVNRAQVSLANEQPSLLTARANVKVAYAALAQLLGVPYRLPDGKDGPADAGLDAPFHVRGSLDYRPFGLSRDECLRRAYDQRPEIRSRTLALDVVQRQIGAEKAATRPQVSAFAAYDLYSQPDVASTNSSFSGYTVGVTASWLLFDGFATLGRVRALRAQFVQAQRQLDAARLQARADVQIAYEQLKTAEATLRPQNQNIALATETLDLTTRNFDAGLNSQLDVLQSRVDLTRTRAVELSGRLAYHNALARLERAMAEGRPGPAEGKDTAPAPALRIEPAPPAPRRVKAGGEPVGD